MQYDFDAVVDRSQSYAAKVEEAILHYGTNDVIPLWSMSVRLRAKRSITYDGD